MNSPTTKDALESLPFLTPQERAEIDELLAGVPEPITILSAIIGRTPDVVLAYLLRLPNGDRVELPPDHPLLEGRPPATPDAEWLASSQ